MDWKGNRFLIGESDDYSEFVGEILLQRKQYA
jgi:hypothetical protein